METCARFTEGVRHIRGKCVPLILMVSRKSRGKCVPVLLNFNSTNKGNCAKCYNRHHLATLGVIAANLAKHCVVI